MNDYCIICGNIVSDSGTHFCNDCAKKIYHKCKHCKYYISNVTTSKSLGINSAEHPMGLCKVNYVYCRDDDSCPKFEEANS